MSWIIDGVMTTETFAYGETPTHATPVKAANAQYSYTFSGWTPAIATVTGEATYTAQFDSTVNEYTVTWVIDGVTTTETLAYGATPTHATPVKATNAQYSYTFSGWTPAIAAVTGDATYTAQFDSAVNEYSVNWSIDGVTTTETLAYGATPAHATPVKAANAQYSYTFSGWTPAIATVTGDATYTAQFDSTVNEYSVNWSIDGVTTTETLAYGATPTHATPEKDADAQYSYTFSGWTPAIATVTGDATYTAQFTSTVNKYTVEFVDEDGTVLKSESVAYGKTPTAPANPSKASDGVNRYTFAGWDKAIARVTGDVTYTATYTSNLITYTITFKDDDGTVLKQNTVNAGAMPVAPEEPVKSDIETTTKLYTFTFNRWTPEVSAAGADTEYTAEYTATEIDKQTLQEKDLGAASIETKTEVNEAENSTTVTTTIVTDDASVTEEVETKGMKGAYYAEFTVSHFSSFEVVSPTMVLVTFDDGTSVTTKSYVKDATVTAETPARSGWRFNGWSPAFSSTATEDVVYTAQWLPVSTGGGSFGGGGGSPVVTPPELVEITDEEAPLSELPQLYADVFERDWYSGAVAYVTAMGLMNGVGDDRFDPNASTTRGMVATILMRMAKGEAVNLDSFSDVSGSDWYAEGAAWASKNGVYQGFEDGTFRGEESITREQLATVLYRYAALTGMDVSGEADLAAYEDGSLVSDYAVKAMTWAIRCGIIQGIGDNRLDPTGEATRAQLAEMIMRFDEMNKAIV